MSGVEAVQVEIAVAISAPSPVEMDTVEGVVAVAHKGVAHYVVGVAVVIAGVNHGTAVVYLVTDGVGPGRVAENLEANAVESFFISEKSIPSSPIFGILNTGIPVNE